jgi:hypothetical protein
MAQLAIQSIQPTSNHVELVVQAGVENTNLEVFYRTDLILGGWGSVTTFPAGSGSLAWSEVVSAPSAFYMVGDANADTDSDGLPDAREILMYGTTPDKPDTDGDGLFDAVDSLPGTLYVGNGSAQTGYPNPFVTNSTPWLSAIHQHPVRQSANGYAVQVALDPDFKILLWNDDAGVEATRTWTRIWGSSDSEWSGPVAVDSSGMVYTAMDAGGSWDGQPHAGLFDFAFCKWNAQGQRLWTRMWGTSEMEMTKALAMDETHDRIYVTGETMGSLGGQTNAGHYDACLTQLDMGGTQQWVRLWGTTDEERTFGVGVDPSGNVYVAGYTLQPMDGQTLNGQIDCFLSKFTTEGDRLWTRLWGSAQSDEPRGGLCVDTQGFIYVVGRTDGSFGGQTNFGGQDTFVTKFSPSGDPVWTRFLGSSSTEEGKGIAIAGDGSVYVGGKTWGAFGGQTNRGSSDIFLAKLTPDGNALWTRIWGSSGSDLGGQVSIDGRGNAYVLGVTTNTFDCQASFGDYDSFVCKFDPSGNHVWTHIWGSPDADDNSTLAADSWGHVYVSGFTLGQFDGQTNAGQYDAFLSRLDSEGGSRPIGPVADGARCPDIRYAGPPLSQEATNYWRIRFFTTNGQASQWSAGTNYFILSNGDR